MWRKFTNSDTGKRLGGSDHTITCLAVSANCVDLAECRRACWWKMRRAAQAQMELCKMRVW